MTGPAGLSEAQEPPGDKGPEQAGGPSGKGAAGAPDGPATRDEVTVDDPGSEQTPAEVLEQAREDESG